MKAICRSLIVSALAVTLVGSVTMAQDHRNDQQSRDHQDQQSRDHQDQGSRDQHHDQQNRDEHHNEHYVHHSDWRRGSHISHNDWDRGEQVDWHTHHLRQPPRGYDWREVDGNYVMAAVATGLIASVIIASHSH